MCRHLWGKAGKTIAFFSLPDSVSPFRLRRHSGWIPPRHFLSTVFPTCYNTQSESNRSVRNFSDGLGLAKTDSGKQISSDAYSPKVFLCVAVLNVAVLRIVILYVAETISKRPRDELPLRRIIGFAVGSAHIDQRISIVDSCRWRRIVRLVRRLVTLMLMPLCSTVFRP